MSPISVPTGTPLFIKNHSARTLRCGHPAAEQLHRRREHPGLTDAHADAPGHQHCDRHRRCGWCQQCENRPRKDRVAEHALAAETAREEAGNEHERKVADEERGENEPLLRLRPAEVVLHRDRSNRDIHPVGVRDDASDEGERDNGDAAASE